jgi:hypothetical protein
LTKIAHVGFLVLLAFGCKAGNDRSAVPTSAGGPTPPSAAGVRGFDGVWQGTTTDGTSVSFTVQNSEVIRFRIVLPAKGGTCLVTADGVPKVAVASSKFTFKFAENGVTTDVTGNFSSATQCSGSYGPVTFARARCENGDIVDDSKPGGSFSASTSSSGGSGG